MKRFISTAVLFLAGIQSVFSFNFFQEKKIADLIIDKNDSITVFAAGEMFTGDMELLTGEKLTLKEQITQNNCVVTGTIDSSEVLKELEKSGAVDFSKIKGKWESYIITETENPQNPESRLLIVAGSDRRGCAYGLLKISEELGVSPLHWWSNVPVTKNPEPVFNREILQGEPSVKYRGIFLNDEDWGLQPWAAVMQDKDIKDIGPNAYEKIFKLMLRLKANTIWPAMHNCTKAFYYYKGNPEVAHKYGIVIGSSHCEPMLRNNVDEWNHLKNGSWNYVVNKRRIKDYWISRISESSKYESIYTMGMRGIHDGAMPGGGTLKMKARRLDRVIKDQRKILDNFFEKTSTVPQIFCPYKEVLKLYRKGINLPDDITLMWADDNYGYIRQLSDTKEQKRSGRAGVYYHLSYWGWPEDYLWLSTTSPALIRYEMEKAYRTGADRIWIFNVGDIKPSEFETLYALELAYDIDNPLLKNPADFTRQWAEDTFGSKYAKFVTEIKSTFYRLAAAGKPEHRNRVSFSFNKNFNEAEIRQYEYEQLRRKSKAIMTTIPEEMKDAWFHLIHYPVAGAALLNRQYYLAEKSAVDGRNYNKQITKVYNKYITEAYNKIRELTDIYNAASSSKWEKMMSVEPRNRPVFSMPSSTSRAEFADASNPGRIIKSSERTSEKSAPGYIIEDINWLGTSGSAVTLIPESSYKQITQPAELIYKLPAGLKGAVTVELRTLPGFKINSEYNLKLSVSVNNGKQQSRDIHVESKSKEWAQRVLQGYGSARFEFNLPDGENKLTVRLYSPGIALDQIRIFQ